MVLDARGINHVIEHADSFSFSPLLFLLSSLCVREIQTIHVAILRQVMSPLLDIPEQEFLFH